jgi:hypothetical protein
MNTVIIPAKIKVIVAIKDLNEILLIPHIPCPDVHPPLILVPRPTKKPPKIINIKESVILITPNDLVKNK